MVFTKNAADIGCGSVFIVGSRLNDEGDAARTVTLINKLLDHPSGNLTRPFFDGSLDRVVWHILRAGGQDGRTQPWIKVGIAAAHPGSHHEFLSQFAKKS